MWLGERGVAESLHGPGGGGGGGGENGGALDNGGMSVSACGLFVCVFVRRSVCVGDCMGFCCLFFKEIVLFYLIGSVTSG